MKTPRLLSFLFALFLIWSPLARAVDWVGMEKVGGVAYFYVSSPAQIQRYDTATRTWLAPLTLPAGRGPLTYATIDADGIYAAYDKAVYRYDLSAGGETHLINTVDTVQSLFTDGNLLLINHTAGYYARVMSVNKTNNAVISSMENYIDSIHGASIARGVNRLFGTTRGISPADVSYVEYRDDGTFVGGGDSPHHGDYSIGTRTWVFPNEGRFADTSGNVYSTTSLSHALSFGTAIDDLAFSGADIPIVLSGNKLTAYTSTLLQAGSATLSAPAKSILVVGSDVVAFRATAGAGIDMEIVALTTLQAPTPGQPADPAGVAYVPDQVFVDEFNIVYLFSKAHQTIFRWDADTQAYLEGIPLIGAPSFVAYSSVNDRVYTASATGLIRELALDAETWTETPFAQLPSAPMGLATAGAYVFTADASGAWESHYTYAPDGTLVSSKEWNYYSLSYVWNDANQKMYFFRDDTSPNDLLWEEINANGTSYPALAPGALGVYMDSPLHTSTGFTHPIRPSPDGTVVVLGSGMLHHGVTLARLATALANPIQDAAWGTDGIYSIRAVSTYTQFQQWSKPTYALGAVRQVPGTPRNILALPNGKLFALVSAADGTPSFYLLDQQLNVLPPPELAAPAGLVAGVQSLTEIQLSWRDVTGESSYRIERRVLPDGAWQSVGATAVSITTAVDATVQLGNLYAYRVIALNGVLASPAGAAVEIAFSIPATPSLAAVLSSASQIRLDWPAANRATSYRLYRRTGASTTWTLLGSPTGATLTYLDGSLASGIVYAYKLQAVNSLGASADSEIVTLTTPQSPPATPAFYTPSALGPNSVSLEWGAASRAETYRIERSPDLVNWTQVAVVPASTVTYLDQSVAHNTTHYYRIFAVNSAGASAASTVRGVTTPQLPPATTPSGLSAHVLSATQIEISWTDSANEAGYRVERRVGEAAWAVLATLPANTIAYVDATAVVGAYYNYRVVAFNARGDVPSAELNARAALVGVLLADDFDPALAPAVWSELSATTVLAGSQGFFSGNALWMGGEGPRLAALAPADVTQGGRLKFRFRAGNSALDGTTLWENSEAGESVALEYSVGGGAWVALSTLNTVYPAQSAWTAHDVPVPAAARSAATRFRWRQAQHSGAGFDTWALDDVEVVGIVPAPPATPPFVLGAANSSRSIALSWAVAERASGYAIERRTSQTEWTAVGSTGVGQTYFTDRTAEPATLYSYRVVARNAAGDSAPSDYTIVGTWSTIAEWRFQNYGTLQDSGLASALEDNGTGVPNLLKFAFNMSATDHFYVVTLDYGVKGMPNLQMESPEGLLQISFIRRRAARNPGITYTVEFSDNLVDWAPAGQELLAAPIDTDFEYVVWEDAPAAVNPRPARFARVRVTGE